MKIKSKKINSKKIKYDINPFKNSLIKLKNIHKKSISYISDVAGLVNAVNNSNQVLIEKGTYTTDITLENENKIIELIGGYIESNNIDDNALYSETIIDGNLSISTSNTVLLKNIQINGKLILNGSIITLNNISNSLFSQITASSIIFKEADYKFNDVFLIGNVSLDGNINCITNGFHTDNSIKLDNYTINFSKTNDNSFPENNNLDDPTDPKFSEQYSLVNSDIVESWNYCDLNKEKYIKVAVIDSGVDTNHPDLVNNFDKDSNGDINGIRYYDGGSSDSNFDDDDGHGTHVAGIIAADVNNNQGIAGISNNDKILIMPVKVINKYGDDYHGTEIDIALGIRWAADNGADIINLSLGTPSKIPLVKSAIDYAFNLGCFIVGAGGNSEYSSYVEYPGAYNNVLSVGSIDSNNNISNYSSYIIDSSYPSKPEGHSGIDLVAPGESIISTYDNETNNETNAIIDSYLRLSGTSMASPIISGIAALLYQQNDYYYRNPTVVRNVLITSSTTVNNNIYSNNYGYGIVNAKNALLFPWTISISNLNETDQIILEGNDNITISKVIKYQNVLGNTFNTGLVSASSIGGGAMVYLGGALGLLGLVYFMGGSEPINIEKETKQERLVIEEL